MTKGEKDRCFAKVRVYLSMGTCNLYMKSALIFLYNSEVVMHYTYNEGGIQMKKMAYGGDYNPEQWESTVWNEDMKLMKQAQMNMATVNVFSWALLQRDEVTYDFSQLDEIMDMLAENGIQACLATGTAMYPAWMAKAYPDILRVDFDGRKRKYGLRHNACPNSPTYRLFAAKLVEKLANRYKSHPALAIWHVSNEYGGDCFCERCEAAFRVWLNKKYGSLEKLNEAWNTSFWSHTFYAWDEIVAPNNLSEHLGSETFTAFQGISLDYKRFNSDSLLACYQMEYDILKAYTSDVPITTNMMGAYKPLDYQKWAKFIDVISWDNYPSVDTPVSEVAMHHDLMRGLKSGQPFMLMEQTPSVTNWQPYNALKRPGVMRLQSYQAIARGADAILFFQIRRSIGACEKFHGALIDHVGHGETRVFRECASFGAELSQLGDTLLDSQVLAEVAIVFDWENWWALELSSGPSRDLSYTKEVWKYYDAFYRKQITVDFVSVDEALERYKVVVAPVLYMTKPGFAEKVKRFVERGGTFVTTFFSGIVDERDLVIRGGYPGELREILGIWVEEIDALPPGTDNEIIWPGKDRYSCSLLCDLLHPEGAEVKAVYGKDFYKGMPALTCNPFGEGKAWYVATSGDGVFLEELVATIASDVGLSSIFNGEIPAGVEATERIKEGKSYVFLLNHSTEEQSVQFCGKYLDLLTSNISTYIVLESKGVAILRKANV